MTYTGLVEYLPVVGAALMREIHGMAGNMAV